jgi:hypothetical protein
MAATAEPVGGRQRRVVATLDRAAGAWLDAGRWAALAEAVRWAQASWQAQAAASWQLGKAMRFLQRDADDGR